MTPPRLATHGGNPWLVWERWPHTRGGILDFSADLNPLGPPPLWKEFLLQGSELAERYPEPTYQNFREAVARAEGVAPEMILPGNGAAELIHLLARWKAGQGVGVVVPTFTEYERAAQACGSPILRWSLSVENGFSLAAPEQIATHGLVFLCNPNNPTGGLWPQEELRAFLHRCRAQGTAVVVDEAYMDFVADGKRVSAMGWLEEFRNLVVLRSLTKILSLPGLRIGYLAGSPEVIGEIARFQPPWPMNALAAHVGARILGWAGYGDYVAESRRQTGLMRFRLEEAMRPFPWTGYPSQANFVLFKLLETSRPAALLADFLASRGILIRVCDDFSGLPPGRFIRLAVQPSEQASALRAALEEWF